MLAALLMVDQTSVVTANRSTFHPAPTMAGLEVGHEMPSGVHAARARPRSAGEVFAQDIEQGVTLGVVQAAITCGVDIDCVQPPNQLAVFLHDDSQGEV